MPDSPPVLLDRAEAARRLHVSPRTVRRYGKGGLLDERQVGPRLKFVTEESVDAMLRGATSRKAGSHGTDL